MILLNCTISDTGWPPDIKFRVPIPVCGTATLSVLPTVDKVEGWENKKPVLSIIISVTSPQSLIQISSKHLLKLFVLVGSASLKCGWYPNDEFSSYDWFRNCLITRKMHVYMKKKWTDPKYHHILSFPSTFPFRLLMRCWVPYTVWRSRCCPRDAQSVWNRISWSWECGVGGQRGWTGSQISYASCLLVMSLVTFERQLTDTRKCT